MNKITEVLPERRKRILTPPSPVEWSDPEDANPDSCVYFLYSAGRIKIGSTKRMHYRWGELLGGSPLPIWCVCELTGGRLTEQKFQKSFDADRLHSEWFVLSKRMREFLAEFGSNLAEAEAEFKAWLLEQKP